MTTAFQVVTEAHAAPAPLASAPWLDGRPTIQYVTAAPVWRPGSDSVIRFVRFDAGVGPMCGIQEESTIHAVEGDAFSRIRPTGRSHDLAAVRLLSPIGPERLGRVVLLEGPGAFGPGGSRALPLEAGGALGSGDHFTLPSPVGLARLAFALVVDEPSRGEAVFGVTTGIVVEAPGVRPAVALGPSLARGLDPAGARLIGGVDGTASEVSRGHAILGDDLPTAMGVIRDLRLGRGDVILVPGSNPFDLFPGSESVYAHVSEVGELRCGFMNGGGHDPTGLV